MYMVPNEERLSKLDLSGISIGQTILFCPKCFWQIVDVGMNPICPKCFHYLHVTKVDQELFDINAP